MIYRQGCDVNSNQEALNNKSALPPSKGREGDIRDLIVSRMDELGIDVWELGRRANLCHTTAWRFVQGRGGLTTSALVPILEALSLEITPRNHEEVNP